eukprot:scaffold32697_cov33-Tisochrysis_lutea.AAC.1
MRLGSIGSAVYSYTLPCTPAAAPRSSSPVLVRRSVGPTIGGRPPDARARRGSGRRRGKGQQGRTKRAEAFT